MRKTNGCKKCACLENKRRGYLYAKAKEPGCNKLALGRHYDDVIETILMGMLYGGRGQTMMPRFKSTNFEGMEPIRSMHLVREKNIIAWKNKNDLQFLQCACRFTHFPNEKFTERSFAPTAFGDPCFDHPPQKLAEMFLLRGGDRGERSTVD